MPRNDFSRPRGQGDSAFGIDPSTIPDDLHRRTPARPPAADPDSHTTGQDEDVNDGGNEDDNKED